MQSGCFSSLTGSLSNSWPHQWCEQVQWALECLASADLLIPEALSPPLVALLLRHGCGSSATASLLTTALFDLKAVGRVLTVQDLTASLQYLQWLASNGADTTCAGGGGRARGGASSAASSSRRAAAADQEVIRETAESLPPAVMIAGQPGAPVPTARVLVTPTR